MSARAALLSAVALAAACNGDAANRSGEVTVQAVQGSGASSPFEERIVTVTGVVSGDFQDGDDDTQSDLGGFYLAALEPDGDPATSDGLFVYEGRQLADVTVGDHVRVSGTVTEFFGETQLAAQHVAVVGRGKVRAIDVALPADGILHNSDGEPVPDLERYEGMLLRIRGPLSVASLEPLDRFGAVVLSAGGRPYVYTSRHAPDAAGYRQHLLLLAKRRIMLDDGARASAPRPVRWVDGRDAPPFPLRVGDRLPEVVGLLRWSRGSGSAGEETWRLMPVGTPQFANSNPRQEAPPVAGTVKVVGLNVLNLFATIDDGESRCGPGGDGACRGADSRAELERQLDKIVSTLSAIDPDIAALTEIENDDGASLELLVAALNRGAGRDAFSFVDAGILGSDDIKVAIVFRPSAVEPLGRFAVLDSRADPRFDEARNRPVLAQTFRERATGAAFTVAAVHLKSKGSDCDADGDPDRGDGQGNCNGVRTRAAAALADWLAADPTGSGDPDVLALGDFNAYSEEDPIRRLEAGGFVHLGNPEVWTYVFDGRSGALDHAFASPSFAAAVTATRVWHVNADEAPFRDYNTERDRDPAWFESGTPWRGSDHDPVIVAIELRRD